MKKMRITDLLSINIILTEVFFLIYVFLLATGFGINGERSPDSAHMVMIIASAVLTVVFGTKYMNELENK